MMLGESGGIKEANKIGKKSGQKSGVETGREGVKRRVSFPEWANKRSDFLTVVGEKDRCGPELR